MPLISTLSLERNRKKCRRLFLKSVFGSIAKVYAAEIKAREQETTRLDVYGNPHQKYLFINDEMSIGYLQWRQGANLYAAGMYLEAHTVLSKCCEMDPHEIDQCARCKNTLNVDVICKIHLMTARCCYALYKSTNLHYHLETAYQHYEKAIESLILDLSLTFFMPRLLAEFARLLEHFGAFQASLQLYTQILNSFPAYHGYFDVMYRSCIVGFYIADATADPNNKETILNQVRDMVQFLLEALPESIDEVHIVLLYALALEISEDIANKFRAPGVYQSLFQICLAMSPHVANAGSFMGNHKAWMEAPHTWAMMATYCDTSSAEGEPILAKYCYKQFIKFTRSNMIVSSLATVLDIKTCLKIANNHAGFQNYEDAVEFALIAYQIDAFHKETRTCLRKWNNIYEAKFTFEEKAIELLSNGWKQRCWTSGFRGKLKDNMVDELEEQHKIEGCFEKGTRELLSYYAPQRWRSHFLYEETCAKRIQATFRIASQRWLWDASIRAHYVTKASEAYQAYLQTPYDSAVRDEIRRVTNHSKRPQKHAINKIRTIIDVQDSVIGKVHGMIKAHNNRKGLLKCILNRKYSTYVKARDSAIKLQSAWRCHKAHVVTSMRREVYWCRFQAASTIQVFYRWRNETFQHAVTRVIARRKRAVNAAKIQLAVFFSYHVTRFLARYRKKVADDADEKRLAALRAERYKSEAHRHKSAGKLQKLHRLKGERALSGLARSNLKSRLQRSGYSCFSRISVQTIKIVAIDDDSPYSSPGIKQSSPQFIACLQKKNVICDSSFTSGDCIMLSSVMRHYSCKLNRLILDNVNGLHPSFETELVAAVGKCRSLRSLSILGGTWSTSFMVALMKVIQSDNPRCVEVCIEKVQYDIAKSTFSSPFVSSVSDLLCDYFNYSVPGLTVLSLHDCGLRDSDVNSLVKGITINSSLTSIILSNNMIEDDGLCKIFMAAADNAARNKKSLDTCASSGITTIDLTANFVRCNHSVRKMFDAYYEKEKYSVNKEHHFKKCIDLYLGENLILTPYQLPDINYFHATILKLHGFPEAEPKAVDDPRVEVVKPSSPRLLSKNICLDVTATFFPDSTSQRGSPERRSPFPNASPTKLMVVNGSPQKSPFRNKLAKSFPIKFVDKVHSASTNLSLSPSQELLGTDTPGEDERDPVVFFSDTFPVVASSKSLLRIRK